MYYKSVGFSYLLNLLISLNIYSSIIKNKKITILEKLIQK